MTDRHRWWQRGIVYEVYVRSFADTDGDGVGDLAGIRSRLDYLAWLGVDALWITPFFPSPMVDNGYDVADYTGVEPLFGSLDDFDRLVADAHDRSMRVICDFVPNHTSDQHPWFRASRSARDDPKREWYLWRDPGPGGGPPSGAGSRHRYQSRFGSSRELRDAANHGCWSEVWFGTKSQMTRSDRAWASASRRSKSSSEPNSGSTPV